MRLRVVVICLVLLALSCGYTNAATVSAKGTVVDAKGTPVAGVTVYAVRQTVTGFDYEEPHYDVPLNTKSDEQGRFGFSALPKPEQVLTSYCFVAYQPDKSIGWVWGKGSLSYWPDSEEPAEGYALKLRGLTEVRGTIVDQNYKPVAGAIVRPKNYEPKDDKQRLSTPAGPFEAIGALPKATTDSKGSFRLTGVPADTIVGYAVNKRGFVLYSGSSSVAQIQLQRAGDIIGRVVDEKGRPVAGAVIGLGKKIFGVGDERAISRKDGSFALRDVAPDSYAVTILWKGFETYDVEPAKVTVKAGETAKAGDMVSPRRVRIAGRVLDSKTGEPLAGADVIADMSRKTATGGYSHVVDESKADKHGDYSIQAIPGPEITIGAYQPLYRSDYMTYTPSGPARNVDIRLEKPPVVKGKVVDEAGHPVAGAQVFIPYSDMGKRSPSMAMSAEARSDASGAFELPVPGTEESVMLFAHKDKPFEPSFDGDIEYALAVVQRADRKSLLAEGVKLVVKPPRTITVTVRDPSGKPVADVWVAISPRLRDYEGKVDLGWRGPTFKMDKTGNGTYDNVIPGAAYDVQATASGHETVALALTPGGAAGWKDHIEIVMPPR